MRHCAAAVAALAAALIGCGGSGKRIGDIDHTEALRQAHIVASRLTATLAHHCGERRPALRHLECHDGGDRWNCPFALSNGVKGTLRVPDPQGEMTIIC
jgi:hypothetical protein